MVFITLGNLSGEYYLFTKIHNVNDRLEMRRWHQKSHVTLFSILVFLKYII